MVDNPHSPTTLTAYYQEGRAVFKVGNAFYRPQTEVVRDLGVLGAAAYQQQSGQLRVLDAMAGCGVRALRYALEAGADSVWANEANREMNPIIQENLASQLQPWQYYITHQDANRVFFDCYNRNDFYDLIDLDSFGVPVPFISTVLWGAKLGGLVYLTSTDGRSVTGSSPQHSLKFYGAYARSHPAAHEQGLRLLMAQLQQQAAAQERGMKPVFAYFTGQTYRIMMRFVKKSQLREDQYGWLGYCHHCGHYQRVGWRQLGRVVCSHDGENLIVTGPMWLGNLHDRAEIENMIALAKQWGWKKRVKLLSVMAQEADLPPYFYPLSNIGRYGKFEIPKRDTLITALQQRGYRACATHINPEGIKTDASFAICLQVARNLSN